MPGRIFISFLNKDVFSHIVSDCEYLSQSTFQDLDNPIELQTGDFIIFFGNTINYHQSYYSILVSVKEVAYDDEPILTYFIEPKSEISAISEETLSYLKKLEYENDAGKLFLFSENGKVVKMLFPYLSQYISV